MFFGSPDYTYFSTYEVVDNDENVVGTIKPKVPKYTGTYWYMYSSLSGDENSNFTKRDPIQLLGSLSNAGKNLFFVILRLLRDQKNYSSEISITMSGINRLLSNTPTTEAKNSMSKGTFYTAINDLIKIDFMKRVKKDTYKVNSNYIFTRKDPNPERW